MHTRRFTLIAIAIILVSSFAVTGMAANQTEEVSTDILQEVSCQASDFIDENGDGICDNSEDRTYKGLGKNFKGTGACDDNAPERTQDRIRERACKI